MELNKIYNEDCLVGMDKIEDKSVDMILCDLPYETTKNKWDIVLPFKELWKQYNRIIKDNGAIVLFADGLFMANLMRSNQKMWRYNLVWDKVLASGFLNANRMPLRVHENICVFYKKLPTYNPQFMMGKPLHGKGSSYIDKDVKNNNYGKFNQLEDIRKGSVEKYPKSILTFSKPHPSKSIHPTQKSEELFKWLIKTYTNEGDLVLDNCMGSGTTAVACIKTNRNYIGFEKDKTYYDICIERIENTYKEMKNE